MACPLIEVGLAVDQKVSLTPQTKVAGDVVVSASAGLMVCPELQWLSKVTGKHWPSGKEAEREPWP